MTPDDDSNLDLEPMDGGRNRTIIVGILVVAISAAGAFYAHTKIRGSQRADSLALTSAAWNELRRCLVGDDLLAEGHPARTARAIEVGLPANLHDVPQSERAAQWPFRCSTHAGVMTHALFESRADDEEHRMLAMLASRAATALEQGQLRTGAHDPQTYLDEIFEVARRAELPPAAPGHGPLPPAAAHPMSPHMLTPLFAEQGDAVPVAHDALAGGTLRLVVGTPTRSLCVVPAPSGTTDGRAELAAIRCRHVAFADAAASVRIAAGDNEAHTFLSIDGAWWDADAGHLVDPAVAGVTDSAGYVSSGSTADTGRFVHIVRGADGLSARVIAAGAAPRVVPLHPPVADAQIAAVGLFGNRVLLAATVPPAAAAATPATTAPDAGHPAAPAPPSGRLYATTLPADGVVALATWTDVAPIRLDPAPVTLEGCHAADHVAAVVRAGDHVAVSFATSTGWSAPVTGDAAAASALSCTSDAVTLTWLETRPHRWIRQLRCTQAACREDHGNVPTFEGDALPVVADVGGPVALVVSPGPGHGLYAVVAPLAEIARADRRAVLDDVEHGGLDVSTPIQIYSRGQTAMVLVTSAHDPTTTYAVRIALDGSFREVRHPGSL